MAGDIVYWVSMGKRSDEYDPNIDDLPDLVSDLELNFGY